MAFSVTCPNIIAGWHTPYLAGMRISVDWLISNRWTATAAAGISPKSENRERKKGVSNAWVLSSIVSNPARLESDLDCRSASEYLFELEHLSEPEPDAIRYISTRLLYTVDPSFNDKSTPPKLDSLDSESEHLFKLEHLSEPEPDITRDIPRRL